MADERISALETIRGSDWSFLAKEHSYDIEQDRHGMTDELIYRLTISNSCGDPNFPDDLIPFDGKLWVCLGSGSTGFGPGQSSVESYGLHRVIPLAEHSGPRYADKNAKYRALGKAYCDSPLYESICLYFEGTQYVIQNEEIELVAYTTFFDEIAERYRKSGEHRDEILAVHARQKQVAGEYHERKSREKAQETRRRKLQEKLHEKIIDEYETFAAQVQYEQLLPTALIPDSGKAGKAGKAGDTVHRRVFGKLAEKLAVLLDLELQHPYEQRYTAKPGRLSYVTIGELTQQQRNILAAAWPDGWGCVINAHAYSVEPKRSTRRRVKESAAHPEPVTRKAPAPRPNETTPPKTFEQISIFD